MKIRRVELKGFVSKDASELYDRLRNGITFAQIDPDERVENRSWVSATLTFEVPVEEKKIELTESELDRIFESYEMLYPTTYKQWLKSKLFGKGGEDE